MINENKNKLFKWIGGKSWLSEKLNLISNEILTKNKNIDTYVEPFAGSLGSFLSISETLRKHNVKNIILNDINSIVINLYKHIKTNHNIVTNKLILLEKEFIEITPFECNVLHKTKDKLKLKLLLEETNKFYNYNRKRFNELKLKTDLNYEEEIDLSVLFLFLMNHCFNSVYRENSKGEFNTPFNWDNKKTNLNNKIETMKNFNIFLNSFNIEFSSLSFDDFYTNIVKNLNNETTLFYYDPPYLNETNNENKYNKIHFDYKQQIELINKIKNKNKNFIYSNHSVKEIENLFSDFEIKKVYRKNIMTPKKENRNTAIEELIVFSNKN